MADKNFLPTTKVSRVHPLFTKDPVNGRLICGAFRAHGKEEFESSGLSPEELVQPDKLFLFKQWVCHNSPYTRSDGHYNGRCQMHGAKQGRPVTHGKYGSKIIPLTPEEFRQISKDGIHKDLNDELTILSHIIRKKLPQLAGEHAAKANRDLAAKIEQMEKAITKLEFSKLKDVMSDIKKMISEKSDSENAEEEIQKSVERYSKVFDIEMKRRKMSDDYVLKAEVVTLVRCLLTIVMQEVTDGAQREKIRREFGSIITRNYERHIKGPNENTESPNNGPEDSDEGSESDYIDAEYSTDTVFEGQS